MNPIEFLKNELKSIAEKFPNVHIKYGFNSFIETHIVELLPLIEYTGNKELDKAWIPLSLQFMQEYADDNIAFISSDSPLSLKEVTFEFNSTACSEGNIISELFAPLTESELHYDFPTQIPNGKIMINALVNLSKNFIKNLNEDEYVSLENAYSQAA
jgi:hypothetical protein